MAEYETIRPQVTGVRTAEIDEGLRAHMNKIYGTMSVGLLVTAGVAWAVGTSDALLSIFRDPITLQPNILGWIAMFLPLIMVFAFGAMINPQLAHRPFSTCSLLPWVFRSPGFLPHSRGSRSHRHSL